MPKAATLARCAVLAVAVLAAGPLHAVDYTGPADQFAGGFHPSNAPWGGFGGGACTAARTPVIFVHGNGDEARNWDFPPSTGGRSVYEEFRAAGYNDCELFGINWLSPSERSNPQLNYHQPSKARLLRDFLRDVEAYTGASRVDVVAHSMGVTVALHGIDYGGLWGSVRRFIGISAGLRGLASCGYVGYANPFVTTCGSQNVFDSNVFGFFPHTLSSWNPRMGDGGFRDRPAGKSTLFYTLRAGFHDQVACTTASFYPTCYLTSLFDSYGNVRAQLDVGEGSTAAQLDYDFSDWSPFNLAGGDKDGVGHFRAKNNTGRIQVNMLTTSCSGTACCSGYTATCGN